MENSLQEILIDYGSFINGYKNLIKSYNKKEADFIQIRAGKIGEYSLQYHGAGCRLEKLGVICEFDFLPENEFPIKFTNWEIYEFCRMSINWNGLNYSLNNIHNGLLELVEEENLFLLELFGLNFLFFKLRILITFTLETD